MSALPGSWFGWFLLYERTQQVEALSAPPQITTELRSDLILAKPVIMLSRPDAHWASIVIPGMSSPSPALRSASRARFPPPLVQFPAITICAFIPSAEFCSFNSFKTSPAKSSVGMFLYALFLRPMKVLSPFIMNASDIFSVGCFQLEFFYFKPKFFKHFKIFLVGASFDCKKVSADEGVGSA